MSMATPHVPKLALGKMMLTADQIRMNLQLALQSARMSIPPIYRGYRRVDVDEILE